MKRFINIVIILILIINSLSAMWTMGNYVYSSGNYTDYFALYVVDDGMFSNFDVRNNTAEIRIIVEVSNGVFPTASFIFEIHENSWDNPVKRFSPDSTSLLQFKNDAGEVISFQQKTSKYRDNWNVLSEQDAAEFYLFLKNTNTLKSVISCEGTSYNFSITSRNLESVINKLLEEKKRGTTKDWDIIITEKYLNSNYKHVSASKNFLLNSNGNDYGLRFLVSGFPPKPRDNPTISVYLYMYSYPFYFKNDINITGITFTVGRRKYAIKESIIPPQPYYIYFSSRNINYKKLNTLLNKGEWVDVEVNFSFPHDPIKVKLKSSELKTYITYPYPDWIMNQ